MSDTAARVRQAIVDVLGVEPDIITDDATIVGDLKADSLESVELMLEFGEIFGFEVPDADAEKILTVGDAIRYFEAKTAQAA